jgi:DNA-directed RNA polymerase subunit M/transcription elongation factor TFIIS
MFIPKRYGESKIDSCPFCGRQAFIKNSQGVPVCKDHKDSILKDMKCACGEYLLMQEGKFGVFFNCLRCGNINMKKALEINSQVMETPKVKEQIISNKVKQIKFEQEKKNPEIKKKQESRNQIVRSDDPRYFD